MEPWLARAARMRPEREAIVTRDGPLSYRGLYERALSVAAALRERGVRPGDRVALALSGGDLVVALHGCLLLGAVAVPIDLRLTETERVRRAGGARVTLDEPVDPVHGQPGPLEPAAVELDEPATIMFTSGTTGGPKEVALSYSNWQWNALGSALALGLDPEERWLCPMPLAHVGGLSIQLRSAIYATTVLLHERFAAGEVAAALADPERRVTLVSLVPTMLSRLLDAGLREPPTLRWALLGGGPIPPALLERAKAARIPVAPSYGMTEACSQIATHGWPLYGFELSIARGGGSGGSAAGEGEAPPGGPGGPGGPARGGPEAGEVLVRGPAVAAGALSPDGWLHTGDLGRLEERGRLSIVGRLADTIVTGGENVAPAEVEAALLEHPLVSDAAVVGRPDPEWGEAVVALVVARPGAEPSEQDLRSHCTRRLAAFQVPKRFELVDALPRGSTGKLLRRELAGLAGPAGGALRRGQKPDEPGAAGAGPRATREN